MAPLKTIKQRVSTLQPALGRVSTDERERSRYRDETQPWRAWYKTARWQKLRRRILKRDLYTCQRTGELLTGKYPAPDGAVVDHIQPHRGDPALFWDEENLHAVSKAYHDSVKQREEQSAIKGVWY